MRNLAAAILCASLILSCQTGQSPVQPAQPQAQSPARKQFIIVLKPVSRLLEASAWTPEDNAAVGEHFKRLQRLTAEGVVILAGRTLNEDASQFGLVIVETDDEAKAREIMNGDPAIAAGIMTGELFPYVVALTRKCS